MKRLLSLLLIALLATTLSGCNKEETLPDEYIFELIGTPSVTLQVGDNFVDKGYIARYNLEDVSGSVTSSSDVDTTKIGTYNLTYSLDHKGNTMSLTRTVIVEYEDVYCSDVLDTDLTDTGYDKCQVTWTEFLNTYVTLSMYVPNDNSIDLGEIKSNVQTILALYTIISDKYTEYEYIVNVWTINENPTQIHTISEDLFNLIDYTLFEQTDLVDFYNAALEPVLELWHDAREACNPEEVCILPDIDALNIRNQYTDPTKIIMDRDNLTITMEENMGLDLGGISKGYVSQLIVDYLETTGLYGYILNNGQSNVSVGGINPRTDDGSFTIAVTDPTDPYDIAQKYGYAWVKLFDGEQLVTSGDYQKFFEVDGTIYHHIIDPVTLFPLNHTRAVSIVTDNAALADLYSTAIFNMTLEDGIAFVNDIPGLEAIWYETDGTIAYSANFEDDYLQELR